MLQECFGIGEKIPRQINMLKLFVLDFLDFAIRKLEDLRVGERQNDRRVRSDDELRIFGHHLFQRGDEGELARWRERGFGFIEQV